MRYQQYSLKAEEPCGLQQVIQHCPYGILHVRDQATGNKLAILVEVSYTEATGIRCRVAHSEKDVMDELLKDAVSLKLCNREKNIYVVADVTVSREKQKGFLNRAHLNVVINKFNFFRKNKFQQMIPAANG
jgi:hypothetical protein